MSAEFEKPEIIQGFQGKRTSEVVRAGAEVRTGRVEFSIILGDITEVDADAIVCPANPGFEYAGFGGVQVAIAQRAGMATFNEAESKAKSYLSSNPDAVSTDGTFVGVPLGFAASTTPGNLDRVKRIIHVNNMRVDKQPPCDEDVVRLSTASVLAVADAEGLESVVIPAIGTGVGGMSIAESMSGVLKGVKDYYTEINPESKVKKVGFVIYAQPTPENALEMQKVLESDVYPRLTTPEDEAKTRNMPTPSYLVDAADTVGDGDIKWIGIEAVATDGEMKKFLWWRNFKGNLADPKERNDVAAFVARLKVEKEADAAIGMGVDLGASNPQTGEVKTVEEPDIIGVYIEASQRPMFNFMTMMSGLQSEAQLRRRYPEKFEEEYQKALATLPQNQ